MTVGKTDEIKQELARKVESTKAGTKLKKSMSIADMIKVMEPQIKKALPEVITPERFTRMALSALNTTPKLNECSLFYLHIILCNVVLTKSPQNKKPALRMIIFCVW